MKINIDQRALNALAGDIAKKTETAINQVADEMKGGDVDQIHRTLMQRVKAVGVEPNAAALREHAQRISKG